ncbi:hypothetical protein OG196_14565 [Kitasatospora purpeofusca]|uniref:hypothetical protein n=1 Tax=Kitasatospora purpeofusca TaxID=67352 RepID=UPI002E157588|nr:hypothetical protein OG196_14565 [Kitasatospora purpeofusca]
MRIIDLDGIQHGAAVPQLKAAASAHAKPHVLSPQALAERAIKATDTVTVAEQIVDRAVRALFLYKELSERAVDQLASADALVATTLRLERRRRFLGRFGRGLKAAFRFNNVTPETFRTSTPSPVAPGRGTGIRPATTRIALTILALTTTTASPSPKQDRSPASGWELVVSGFNRFLQRLESTYLLIRSMPRGITDTGCCKPPRPDWEVEPLATACGITRLGVAIVPRAPGHSGACGRASGSQAAANQNGHQHLTPAA